MMRARVPDPEYTASRRARSNFVLAMKTVAGFVFVIWAVFGFDQFTGLQLIRYGLTPRDAMGLIGLVTTPLLHYNLAHIASNTLPLLVGGTMMLFLYPNSSVRALPAIWLGSGLLAWLFARDSIHIGASGLIYGVLAFVFISGVLRRDLRSIGAALLVWFLYGSMIWGVLPVGRGMSWELHASGLVLGIAMALLYREWDQPPMKRYDWEDEELPEDVRAEPWREEPERWH
ncbi:MAG: rhomboid family intramembrane serine protease [Candidatus Wenzhouxiangella sp. M2_3B_020]